MYDERIPYQDAMLCIKVNQHMKIREPLLRLWHYHRELEWLYIQEGSLQIRVQEQVYTLGPGGVLLVGSSQPHATWTVVSEKVIYLTLHFDLNAYSDPSVMLYYRTLYEIDGPLSRFNEQFHTVPQLREDIGRAISGIYHEMHCRRRGSEVAIGLYVKQLLLSVLRSESEEEGENRELPPASNLRQVFDYVERHLSDKIEMDTISKMTNMSYHYFSKYFKKTIGLSFVQYVNIQRIKKAERLLLTEQAKITEIAEKVGITNMTHFYQLFKRYNRCSPKEYALRLTTNADKLSPSSAPTS
ncbi:helix-turn-helix domain-containing protein [Paenibacillus oceani]|uniref:Helix-turn-helix transcriptional regulator n=1 Tax=Paenibacillus oceani TaxID=2772510 RepID=A0A927CB56_9BACL|nr:AraC family transcriptional regulator [Paenibacillus oceani]MBD2863502.1 helix-turn-helix transcriptional regulator [Paenibacillus oceani]